MPWLANWHYLEENPVFNKTFDVSLHLGTLVAVVVYFWNDVVRYTIAWFRSVRARAIRNSDERLAWAIAIATVPAAIVGALGEDAIDRHLGEPWQIAFFLAFFAILLWVADRSPQRFRLAMLRLPTAVAVGISQVLALMPGVSRSGITITAGRFARLDRDAAARFSFLLLIPIVLGAVLYKGLKHVAARPAAAGLHRPVHRRHDRLGRGRPRRDRPAARLRAQAQLPAVRDLPPRDRGADRDRDRRRLARQQLLAQPEPRPLEPRLGETLEAREVAADLRSRRSARCRRRSR